MAYWLAQSAVLSTTNHTTAIQYQTPRGQIPGDEPQQQTDGNGGKTREECEVSYFRESTVMRIGHVLDINKYEFYLTFMLITVMGKIESNRFARTRIRLD